MAYRKAQNLDMLRFWRWPGTELGTRFNDRCAWCNTLVIFRPDDWFLASETRLPHWPRQATRDHIIPASQGGIKDVVIACRRCNQFRGDSTARLIPWTFQDPDTQIEGNYKERSGRIINGLFYYDTGHKLDPTAPQYGPLSNRCRALTVEEKVIART